MRVFISWSGERSRELAGILHRWLPTTLQAVRPYFTPDDVGKGTRWSTEIAKELEAARFGLLCMTPDNLTAPWILFEAGALAKSLDRSRVCPVLFGIEPTALQGPLAQFQAARFDQAEIKRVLQSINAQLGEAAVPGGILDAVFAMSWPVLQHDVAAVMSRPGPEPQEPIRSDRAMIEEILVLARAAVRRQEESAVPLVAIPATANLARDIESILSGFHEQKRPRWPPWAIEAHDHGVVLTYQVDGAVKKATAPPDMPVLKAVHGFTTLLDNAVIVAAPVREYPSSPKAP